jgi:eukaryotic-like serine/threonine-protein kinase
VSSDLPTSPTRPAAELPPQRDGRAGRRAAGFEILEELGRGAESTVYRVRASGHRRAPDGEYVLKLTTAPAAPDVADADAQAGLVAFRREAALMAAVDHPRIDRVHEVGVLDGRPYVVRDVVPGVSLAQRLGKGVMSAGEVVRLALDLVGPLTAMHDQGLVHRDLKPPNVMVSPDGTARVIDFGLTTRQARSDDAVVGTLTYTAPEQAGLLNRPVDNRSDLYSLGVILFEALAGRPPFAADDVGELLRRHAVAAPPDLRELAPGTPPGLAAVIYRLLAKDPDDRYQDGRALAADLLALGPAPAREAVPAPPATRLLSGRAQDRAALAAAWARARAGSGGVALLRGGRGAGKGFLAAELAATARATGALVLHAGASGDDVVPFGPLRAALEEHLQALAGREETEREQGRARIRAAATGLPATLLAGLAPGLGALLGVGSAGRTGDGTEGEARPDGPDGTNQFAAATAAFLLALAGPDGLLLILEELQWLDPGSRRVLAQLPPRLRSSSMLVLLTVRDDSPDPTGPDPTGPDPTGPDPTGGPEGLALEPALESALEPALESALEPALESALEPALDLTLGPLDEAGVAEQIRALLPGLEVEPRLVELMHVRSNGNPFVVQEYLRAVVDAGLLHPDWGRWTLDEAGLDALELPQDAVGLVLARVHGLPAATRELLVTAAVRGTRFRPEVIAAVHDRPVPDVLVALAEAVDRRLIEPRATGEYAFLHEGIREVLLGDLDPVATADRHRRIAEALAGLPPAAGEGDDHLYAIAHHYRQGGPGVAVDAAFEACWAAGRAALAGHAPAEAVLFLEHAAGLRRRRRPAGFLVTYGTALMRTGRLGPARDCLEQALPGEVDPLRRAEIHTLLADVHRAAWNAEAARRSVDAGLRELGVPMAHARPRLLLSLPAVAARAVVAPRVPVSGRQRERAVAESALHAVGGYAGVIGMLPEVTLAHVLRLPALARQIGPGAWNAYTQSSLGFLYATLGLARPAEQAFARARADPSQADPAQAAITTHFRGAAFYLGGLEDGRRWARDVERVGQALDVATFLDAAASLNLMAVVDGRTRDAEHWLALGRRRLGEWAAGATAFVSAAAVTYALLGRSAEAGAELRRMDELCAGTTARALTMIRLASTITVLVEQGEIGTPLDEATAAFEALAVSPGRIPRMHRGIFYRIAVGRLAQLRADPSPRRRAVARRAVARAAAVGGGPELRTRGILARADLAVLEGRPVEALHRLRRIDDLQTPDAPMVAFESARIRARALRLLQSRAYQLDATDGTDGIGTAGPEPVQLGAPDGAARRQARLAAAIATEQRWPHRTASVVAEFALASSEEGREESAVGPSGPAPGLERQRLQALQQVSAAASRVLEPDELARIALDETIRILAADRAFLFLTSTDRAGGGLVAHLGRDGAGHDVPQLTGYSTTLVERVRISGQPLVVTGTEEGAALGATSVVRHGLRSILVAPLQLEGRLLGVVYLDSQVAKGIFTAEDAGILTALTNHIAVSLETARAAQLEISVTTARRQRDLAETLRRTLQSMSDTVEPDEVIRRMLAALRQLLACEGAWLVSLPAPDDARAPQPASRIVLAPDGALTRTPAEVDDRLLALIGAPGPVAGTPDRVPRALAGEPLFRGGPVSWIAVPVRVHDGRSGTVVLGSDRADADLTAGVELAAAVVGQGTTSFEKATLFEQVQELAVVDELTGVANRRHFFEVAARDLAAAARHRRPVTVLMIDIDHFKRINDSYGHATGDDVIRLVAHRLAAGLRTADLLARYGGEEFAVLLSDPDGSGEGRVDLPERLRTAICDVPIETRSGAVTVSVSIGVAWRGDTDLDDVTALLARADRQLYRAKASGRNRVCAEPA